MYSIRDAYVPARKTEGKKYKNICRVAKKKEQKQQKEKYIPNKNNQITLVLFLK